MEHYAETDQLLRDEFNLPATRYDGDAATALEPAIKPGVAGAWHYLTDGHLRSRQADARLAPARSKRSKSRSARSVGSKTSPRPTVASRSSSPAEGDVAADQVVVATGGLDAAAREVAAMLAAHSARKGYSVTMPRPAKGLNCR